MEIFSFDIFRFFNFILIVSVLVYLFKRYILLDINLIVVQNESGKKKLYIKQRTLEDTLFALTNEIERETVFYEQLQQKIIVWKRAEQKKNEENMHATQLVYTTLQTRCHTQAREREVDMMLRKEISVVVVMLMGDIEKKYNTKQSDSALNRDIIAHMDDVSSDSKKCDRV